MILLKALKPLSGSYGRVSEGQTFKADHDDAESLEARGLAERYRIPTAETKGLWQRAVAKQPKLAKVRF